MTNWLKKRRQELGLSQGDLLKSLDELGFKYTGATISHWENKRYNLPLDRPGFVEALGQILNFSPEQIADFVQDAPAEASAVAEPVRRGRPPKDAGDTGATARRKPASKSASKKKASGKRARPAKADGAAPGSESEAPASAPAETASRGKTSRPRKASPTPPPPVAASEPSDLEAAVRAALILSRLPHDAQEQALDYMRYLEEKSRN